MNFRDEDLEDRSSTTSPTVSTISSIEEQPERLVQSSILILHRGVIKLATLSKEDQDSLGTISLKLPAGQKALKIPIKIDGIRVEDPEMMYKVKFTAWIKEESAAKKEKESGAETQSTTKRDVTGNETSNEKKDSVVIKKDSVVIKNDVDNPFDLAEVDEFTSTMCTNQVSAVDIDLTQQKDDDDDQMEIPPLQPLETFIKRENIDEDCDEDDDDDDVSTSSRLTPMNVWGSRGPKTEPFWEEWEGDGTRCDWRNNDGVSYGLNFSL